MFAVFSLADFSTSLLKNSLNEFVGLADLAVPERGPGRIFNWSERAAHAHNELQKFSLFRVSRANVIVKIVVCVPPYCFVLINQVIAS